ncbi:MAG: serine/threonine protein kinase [Pyrinomonadaceae bacterium]
MSYKGTADWSLPVLQESWLSSGLYFKMRELSLNNSRVDKRYDVAHELGRGSYAEIFVARDTLASTHSSHNHVVIKALNVFLQDDLDPDLERTLVENFQNEAVALDRVRHPNIISRLGHGTARDLKGTIFHYLVLEYLEGGDLQKASREKNLTLKNSLKYIEQICAGLKHAHRNNIIHRDIKPQNLLLTKDRETLKIADFGVARIHLSDSPITRVGTNVYAPPEHSPLFSGDGDVLTVSALTPAADIYSLAKSVYALITGEAPRFYANKPITALPITVKDEYWSSELLRVIEKATAGDPSRRHQGVDEFWSDLEDLRRLVAEKENSTQLLEQLNDSPQPHVARGYTPMPPQQPRFNTSREMKLRHPLITNGPLRVDLSPQPVVEVPNHQPMQLVEDHWPNQSPLSILNSFEAESPEEKPKQRKLLRKASIFVILFAIFAGGLYATQSYLRGLGFFPDIESILSTRTGKANTDIYLRPSPNTNNEPIGMVTKNSRVRIVKSQNNWYQVDVIEQGRQRNGEPATNSGWLNGKYVDLD